MLALLDGHLILWTTLQATDTDFWRTFSRTVHLRLLIYTLSSDHFPEQYYW